MAFRLTYEKQTCTRCGGGGHYSYCQRYGTTCFGCGGTGKASSKAGKKAADAVHAFIEEHFSVEVQNLQPGDRVKLDGQTATIESVQTSDGSKYGVKNATTGETVWMDYVTLHLAKPVKTMMGGCTSFGYAQGTKVVRAVGGADWDQVVAFAQTIKKGVTVEEVL